MPAPCCIWMLAMLSSKVTQELTCLPEVGGCSTPGQQGHNELHAGASCLRCVAACTSSSLPPATRVEAGKEAAAAAGGDLRACHSGQRGGRCLMKSVTFCALGLLDWVKGD